MIKISVPATSANIGIGFDCMGIALDIYNTFYVELSDQWIFEGIEQRFCNEDNLFVQAFYKGLKALNQPQKCCYLKMETDVPVCRGMGSSATMIVAGLMAANYFCDEKMSKEELLKLASEMEGHPDNVAPAIYGGLCICKDGLLLQKRVHDDISFGTWIPDFELSTEMARGVLPQDYKRGDVVENVASALLGIEGLVNGDEKLIACLMNDHIHEPYRRKLITGFEDMKQFVLQQGACAFIISGSGSTCLSIQKKEMNPEGSPCPQWFYRKTQVCSTGAQLCRNSI